MASSSFPEQLEQINKSLQRAGGHYEGYSCKMSWDVDDAQQGTTKDSSGGTHITCTRLLSRDGRLLFTVQRKNWNERLGKVTADDISVVTSHSVVEEAGKEEGRGILRSVTLRSVLQNPSEYVSYASLQDPNLDLHDGSLDREISIRFQTIFLPLKNEEDDLSGIEFVPTYKFSSIHSNDSNPRNMILLCTAEGLAIQEDGGAGGKKLFHHSLLPDGCVSRHWLQAEPSQRRVGCSEEGRGEGMEDTLECGNSVASTFGVMGMEGRSDAVMIIQIPVLKGKDEAPPDTLIQPTPKKNATEGVATHQSFQYPSANSGTTQQEKQSSTTTRTKLLQSIKALEMQTIHMEMKIDSLMTEAKARMAKGDKKGALFKMKCKKTCEHELDRIEESKLRLEAQIMGSSTVKNIRTEVGVETAEESLNQIQEDMEAPHEFSNASTQPKDALLLDYEEACLLELERLETCGLGGELGSVGASKNCQYINHDLEAQKVPLGDASPEYWLLVPNPPLPTRKSSVRSSTCKVSKGSIVDFQEKGLVLSVANPRRHPEEHITVTVVMCRVCSGSIPTGKDVKAAVDDIEEMYNSVDASDYLANEAYAFVKSEFQEGGMTEEVNGLEEELLDLLPPFSSPGIAVDEEEDSLGGGSAPPVLSSSEAEELKKLEEELAGL